MKNWHVARGSAVAMATALAGAGCAQEAGREAIGTAGSGDNPSAAMLGSMLGEEGMVARPPAQEFSLPELGFDLGAATAPIRVVEFSDYGCGFCRRFHTETFPGLKRDYIDTGRVLWKYVTYVSGMFPNGLPAAFAAECAGEQGLFPPMSQALYERQSEWKGVADPAPFLQELATELGADPDEFMACMAEERPRARVRSGVITGGRLGVRGTPSFLVNTVPVMGAQPREYWDTVFNAIEAEIDRMKAEGDANEAGPPPAPHP